MFPSPDTPACFPLPSRGYRGRSLRKPCGSPPSSVLWGRKTAQPSIRNPSGRPCGHVPLRCERRWGALLGSWEIPVETCPELVTPATPAQPRNNGPPNAAFRLVNSVGIATSRVFGADLHSLFPCCIRFALIGHPVKVQHSLPACLLDCDRAIAVGIPVAQYPRTDPHGRSLAHAVLILDG